MKNKMPGTPHRYQDALDLAEAGNHQEALDSIQEYLCSSPDDAEALNDAGAILHCLGRSDEGVKHLIKARALQSDSAEIIWNLVEAYLVIGKAKDASELFDDMQQMDILTADVINRTADVFLKNNDLCEAEKMLKRSLKLSPNQQILIPMIEIINQKITEKIK